MRLLKSVAAQTGLALENADLMSEIADEVAQRERLNREVEIAREVQERLFPQTLPAIAVSTMPAPAVPRSAWAATTMTFLPCLKGGSASPSEMCRAKA